MSSRKFTLENALRGVISYHVSETILPGTIQVAAVVSVEIFYECKKIFGKCIEDGKIVLEVLRPPDVEMNIEVDRLANEGKLEAEFEQGEPVINLRAKRGKGTGRVVYNYIIKTLAQRPGEYIIVLGLNYVDVKKQITKRLGDPLEIPFTVSRPFTFAGLFLKPEVPYYTPGDVVKVIIEVDSKYRGIATLTLGGILRESSHDIELTPGRQEISIEAFVENPNNTVDARIYIPSLKYEDVIRERIVIGTQRIAIEKLDLGRLYIGKPANITIEVSNQSLISPTPIKVGVEIFGFSIETREVLGPGEKKSLKLTTPTLTKESSGLNKGLLVLYDEVSGKKIERAFEALKPLFVSLKATPIEQRLRIPSSSRGKIALSVTNESEVPVELYLSDLRSTNCLATTPLKQAISPGERVAAEVEVKPIAISRDTSILVLHALVDGIPVEVYEVPVEVEVYRSFRVREIKVIKPKGTQLAVKSQDLFVELVFDVNASIVELLVESPDLAVEKKKYTLYQPSSIIQVSGKPLNYGDGIRLIVTDGLFKEEVIIPIRVEPLSIVHELVFPDLYVGLVKYGVLRLRNKFEVPLKVQVEFEADGAVEFTEKKLDLILQPLSSDDIPIGTVGVFIGEHRLKYRIIARIVHPFTGEVVEEWDRIESVRVRVISPIKVEVQKYSEKLLLPAVTTEEIKRLWGYYRFVVSVKNLSDTVVPAITIEPRVAEDKDVSIGLLIKSLILRPGEEEKVSALVHIPVYYSSDILEIGVVVKVREYPVYEELIVLPVERYVFTVIEVKKKDFVDILCPYPRLTRGDDVLVLLPVKEENYSICGKPSGISVERFMTMNALYKYFAEIRRIPGDPWSTAGLLVFKKSCKIPFDIRDYQNFLEEVSYVVKNVSIVPGLLWFIAISKLIGVEKVAFDVSKVIEISGIGLLYSRLSPVHESSSNFHCELAKSVVHGVESRVVEEHMSEWLKTGRVDPLVLLYTLSTGRLYPYNESVVEKLWADKRYNEFLTYLAVVNKELVEDSILLSRIREALGVTTKKSSLLALAILFSKLIHENSKKVRGE